MRNALNFDIDAKLIDSPHENQLAQSTLHLLDLSSIARPKYQLFHSSHKLMVANRYKDKKQEHLRTHVIAILIILFYSITTHTKSA